MSIYSAPFRRPGADGLRRFAIERHITQDDWLAALGQDFLVDLATHRLWRPAEQVLRDAVVWE